jgi:hypothetical protein
MDCVKRDRSTAPQHRSTAAPQARNSQDHAARALLARALTSLTSMDYYNVNNAAVRRGKCGWQAFSFLRQATYSKSLRGCGFSEW